MDIRLLGDASGDLHDLHRLTANYSLASETDATAANGWKVDDYVQRLPREEPGSPVPGGTWEIAKELVDRYEFADPSIITAVWLPDAPLAERDMLLEGRFLFLRFLLAVRVNRVVDETRTVDGREQRVWGWCYTTLQGHVEMGEMCYTVVKWLDTGEVEFRVHRYSKRGIIRNVVLRLGFVVFGRFMQVLFVRRSLARMKRLVETRLTTGPEQVTLAADQIQVGKASYRPR